MPDKLPRGNCWTWDQADPWSIGDIGILDNNQLANGPGISQRAAAARTQTVWRWLVHCGPGLSGGFLITATGRKLYFFFWVGPPTHKPPTV